MTRGLSISIMAMTTSMTAAAATMFVWLEADSNFGSFAAFCLGYLLTRVIIRPISLPSLAWEGISIILTVNFIV